MSWHESGLKLTIVVKIEANINNEAEEAVVSGYIICRSLFALLSYFRLANILSVLLRYTSSDYPFGIFGFCYMDCSCQCLWGPGG